MANSSSLSLSLSLGLPSVEQTALRAILDDLNSYTFLYPLTDSSESESDDDDDYHSLPPENVEVDTNGSDLFLDSGPMDTDGEEEDGFESEADLGLEEWVPDELSDGSDSDGVGEEEERDLGELFDTDLMDPERLRISEFRSEHNLGELNPSLLDLQVEQDEVPDLNRVPDWADTEELPEFLQMDIDVSLFHDLDPVDQYPNPNSHDETTDELYDCVQFDDQREDLYPTQNPNQDQEWEAISTDDSSQSDLEERVRHLEWEVLLAVNSLYDDVEPFFDSERPAEVTFFRQLLENDGFIKGGPPASKSVVESLPSVCVSKIDFELQCAVCKDSFLVGESVKRLPCLHDYHAKCIVPWLGMRNTCPLCRYELATDDIEYDNWRANLENRV